MKRENLEKRIQKTISQQTGIVVLRSDFVKMGSSSHISRVLSHLVEVGKLIRVSKGVFAKTRINKFTGQFTPAGTLESISAELFKRLGIEISPNRYVIEYNKGNTTQIPAITSINTKNRRITRKITVGNRTLVYEKNL